MIAKIWKKLLFAILIIACLFNIVNKLVHKASLEQELQSSAQYIQEQRAENMPNKNNCYCLILRISKINF